MRTIISRCRQLALHEPDRALAISWLAGQGIDWVEDPFNTDPAYTRSRIRHQLLPALADTFPGYRETFTRSAS